MLNSLDHTPKEIPLTQGYFATVCSHDYEEIRQWKWSAALSSGNYYAIRTASPRRTVRMHTLVNKTPGGKLTDHLNRVTLDNRCINLRTVTNQQNQENRKLQSNNKTGVKGVSYNRGGYWVAQIGADILGYFKDFEEAKVSRLRAEVERGYIIQ